MDAVVVDGIELNFNRVGLFAINAVIGLMMFGVALDMRGRDFTRLLRSPRAPLIGLAAQFVLLPAFTFGLIWCLGHFPAVAPIPSIALGMMLVAACPGGNLSNLMTYLGGGNAAVSVSMTAVSTVAAIVMTPLNLSLWGNLNPDTAEILRQVELSPVDVFVTVFVILGIPLALGLLVAHWKPRLVERVRKPFKVLTVVIFLAVVGAALGANGKIFVEVIGLVAFAVLLHNALALTLGYTAGRAARLPRRDVRAVTVEVGIQNSALGLVLVFSFFEELGGMAIVVAWWGIWHIVSGLTVAAIWSRIPLPAAERGVTS